MGSIGAFAGQMNPATSNLSNCFLNLASSGGDIRYAFFIGRLTPGRVSIWSSMPVEGVMPLVSYSTLYQHNYVGHLQFTWDEFGGGSFFHHWYDHKRGLFPGEPFLQL